MIFRSLTITTALLFHGLIFADDWPNFQGPKRLGVSTETGLNLSDWESSTPSVVWRKTINPGFGGAAISGDEVFIVDREPAEADRLLCLDIKDGSQKWSYEFKFDGKLSFPGTRGVPFVSKDAVYFIGGFGQVHRVNRKTHKADWVLSIQDEYDSEPPNWGWAQSPVIADETMIVPVMSASVGLIGIDINSGKEKWRTDGLGSSHSTPTVIELHGVKQAVFIASIRDDLKGQTISVEPATGKVLWQTDLYYNKHPIPFVTKVSEDQLFLTGGYECGSMMIKVNKDWQVSKEFEIDKGSQIHPPMLIDNHLYFLANENANYKGSGREKGGLTCMDLKGKTLWNTGAKPYMGRGAVMQVADKLLIQDGDVGFLRVIDPSTSGFRQLGEFDPFEKKQEVAVMLKKQKGKKRIKLPDFKYWSPMALSNGKLVMRGQENLVCLDLNLK